MTWFVGVYRKMGALSRDRKLPEGLAESAHVGPVTRLPDHGLAESPQGQSLRSREIVNFRFSEGAQERAGMLKSRMARPGRGN